MPRFVSKRNSANPEKIDMHCVQFTYIIKLTDLFRISVSKYNGSDHIARSESKIIGATKEIFG